MSGVRRVVQDDDVSGGARRCGRAAAEAAVAERRVQSKKQEPHIVMLGKTQGTGLVWAITSLVFATL